MYIFIYFVVLIVCNMCLLFALLFVWFHVDHNITNASLYINFTVNMRLTVSEKSIFPTSFRHGCLQGNLFLFEKHK